MEIDKYRELAHVSVVRITVLTPFGTARFSQYEGESIDWGNTTAEQKQWIKDKINENK
jgi:hypothetical protein